MIIFNITGAMLLQVSVKVPLKNAQGIYLILDRRVKNENKIVTVQIVPEWSCSCGTATKRTLPLSEFVALIFSLKGHQV